METGEWPEKRPKTAKMAKTLTRKKKKKKGRENFIVNSLSSLHDTKYTVYKK